MHHEGREGGWGGSWILSTTLITLGVIVAIVAIAVGVVGGFVNADEAGSLTRATSSIGIALGGIVLVGTGATLRGCCYGCDWEDERPIQIRTEAPTQK